MKKFLEKFSFTLVLALSATIFTACLQAKVFRGDSLTFWVVFAWLLAALVVPLYGALVDEVDDTTTLARFVLIGVMLLALKCSALLGLDVVYSASVVLAWRWMDIGLMWVNWHRCQH